MFKSKARNTHSLIFSEQLTTQPDPTHLLSVGKHSGTQRRTIGGLQGRDKVFKTSTVIISRNIELTNTLTATAMIFSISRTPFIYLSSLPPSLHNLPVSGAHPPYPSMLTLSTVLVENHEPYDTFPGFVESSALLLMVYSLMPSMFKES